MLIPLFFSIYDDDDDDNDDNDDEYVLEQVLINLLLFVSMALMRFRRTRLCTRNEAEVRGGSPKLRMPGLSRGRVSKFLRI